VKLADKAKVMLNNIARPLSIRRAALCGVLVLAMFSFPRASDLFQPYRVVNAHTAGVLPKASFDVDFHIYASPDWPGGGLLPGVHVGLSDRFNIGLSYGGEGIIGYSNRVRWNALPGILVKYRLLEEGVASPALAIGFDNQGYGGSASKAIYGYDGYVYKSPGFFAAFSKNYLMFTMIQIGFHGTLNYSIEGVDEVLGADEVRWANLAVGTDIGISDEIAFFFEYDFAFNDVTGANNDKHIYALPHKGFLNIGLRWVFTENFYIEFDMLDIFENKTRLDGSPIGWGRELKVAYVSKF
jgi:hypothetical protein